MMFSNALVTSKILSQGIFIIPITFAKSDEWYPLPSFNIALIFYHPESCTELGFLLLEMRI